MNFCKNLDDHNHGILARLCGVIFLDFHRAFKIGLRSILGLSGRAFHLRGLNPNKPKDIDIQKIPTLFINGNAHNQGVWLPMAKMLANKDLGSLFTVNLSSGTEITDKHLQQIEERVNEIHELYTKAGLKGEFKINIVGYSFSGIVAVKYGEKMAQEKKIAERTKMGNPDSIASINKIISLGAALPDKHLTDFGTSNKDLIQRYYEVTANYDALDFDKSLLLESKHAEVETTHLGLPSSQQTASKIAEWLKETPITKNKTDAT